jgi:hypothetical protein
MTYASTVWKYSMNAAKGRVPVSHLHPLIPTGIQNAINSPTAQNVAPGESMNLTKPDFFLFFQSMRMTAAHSMNRIRFRGNAIRKAGKSPSRN